LSHGLLQILSSSFYITRKNLCNSVAGGLLPRGLEDTTGVGGTMLGIEAKYNSDEITQNIIKLCYKMLQSNLGGATLLRDVLRGARLQNLERVSPHRIIYMRVHGSWWFYSK